MAGQGAAVPEPLRALVARELRRPHFLAMLCMGPLAAISIVGLQRVGLVAPSPIWLIPAIIIAGQTAATLADLMWTNSPTRLRLHARVAVQAIVVTATIYSTGWGPGLAIGLLLVGQESLTVAGSGAADAVAGWNILCLTLGEVLLALGWVPSLLPVPEVHSLAVLMGIGLIFSYRSLATALREKEEAAALVDISEQRFRALVQNAQDLVFVVDSAGKVSYASPSCAEVLGFEPSELVGVRPGSLVHVDDIDALRALFSGMLTSGETNCEFRIRVRGADDTWRWLEGVATNLLDVPAVDGLVLNVRDVTRRQMREERQCAVTTLGNTALNDTSLELLMNEAVELVMRLLPATSCRIVAAVADHANPVQTLASAPERAPKPGPARLEVLRYPIGDPRQPLAWTEVVAAHPVGPDEVHFLEAIGGVVMSSIVRQRAEEAIRHQALHDPLTGLPNRALLHDRLDQGLTRAARDGGRLALLLLDLDGFKEINDTLGHAIGDQVLVRLGERLLGAIRASDTVARLGGDEFAVVLERVNSDAEALALATTMLDAIGRAIQVDETQLCLTASIGVALYPEHGTTPTDLLKHADIAMYEAKRLGTIASLYKPETEAHSAQSLTLMSQLGPAITQNELAVHYQPKIALASGHPIGVEALVRWNHPELGLVAPDRFIPLAEQSGTIGTLTTAVLRASIEQMRRWSLRGLDLDLAINISARSLHDQQLAQQVIQELERGQFSAERLVLEITETAVMSDRHGMLRVLQQLANLGVRVSIDDFGTGHCSLAYLHDLPIHEIKLDRTYVVGLCRGGRDASLAHSIIDLGKRLGIDVVAEGIEDAETLTTLISVGASLGQGYFISPPRPGHELDAWLMAHSNLPETERTGPLVHGRATG